MIRFGFANRGRVDERATRNMLSMFPIVFPMMIFCIVCILALVVSPPPIHSPTKVHGKYMQTVDEGTFQKITSTAPLFEEGNVRLVKRAVQYDDDESPVKVTDPALSNSKVMGKSYVLSDIFQMVYFTLFYMEYEYIREVYITEIQYYVLKQEAYLNQHRLVVFLCVTNGLCEELTQNGHRQIVIGEVGSYFRLLVEQIGVNKNPYGKSALSSKNNGSRLINYLQINAEEEEGNPIVISNYIPYITEKLSAHGLQPKIKTEITKRKISNLSNHFDEENNFSENEDNQVKRTIVSTQITNEDLEKMKTTNRDDIDSLMGLKYDALSNFRELMVYPKGYYSNEYGHMVVGKRNNFDGESKNVNVENNNPSSYESFDEENAMKNQKNTLSERENLQFSTLPKYFEDAFKYSKNHKYFIINKPQYLAKYKNKYYFGYPLKYVKNSNPSLNESHNEENDRQNLEETVSESEKFQFSALPEHLEDIFQNSTNQKYFLSSKPQYLAKYKNKYYFGYPLKYVDNSIPSLNESYNEENDRENQEETMSESEKFQFSAFPEHLEDIFQNSTNQKYFLSSKPQYLAKYKNKYYFGYPLKYVDNSIPSFNESYNEENDRENQEETVSESEKFQFSAFPENLEDIFRNSPKSKYFISNQPQYLAKYKNKYYFGYPLKYTENNISSFNESLNEENDWEKQEDTLSKSENLQFSESPRDFKDEFKYSDNPKYFISSQPQYLAKYKNKYYFGYPLTYAENSNPSLNENFNEENDWEKQEHTVSEDEKLQFSDSPRDLKDEFKNSQNPEYFMSSQPQYLAKYKNKYSFDSPSKYTENSIPSLNENFNEESEWEKQEETPSESKKLQFLALPEHLKDEFRSSANSKFSLSNEPQYLAKSKNEYHFDSPLKDIESNIPSLNENYEENDRKNQEETLPESEKFQFSAIPRDLEDKFKYSIDSKYFATKQPKLVVKRKNKYYLGFSLKDIVNSIHNLNESYDEENARKNQEQTVSESEKFQFSYFPENVEDKFLNPGNTKYYIRNQPKLVVKYKNKHYFGYSLKDIQNSVPSLDESLKEENAGKNREKTVSQDEKFEFSAFPKNVEDEFNYSRESKYFKSNRPKLVVKHKNEYYLGYPLKNIEDNATLNLKTMPAPEKKSYKKNSGPFHWFYIPFMAANSVVNQEQNDDTKNPLPTQMQMPLH